MERKVILCCFYCFKMTCLLGFIRFYVPGNYEEGELPQDSVFPDSNRLDSFMQQMCDAIHGEPMDVDTNIDTEQVNSVEPTILCSGISKSDDTLLE